MRLVEEGGFENRDWLVAIFCWQITPIIFSIACLLLFYIFLSENRRVMCLGCTIRQFRELLLRGQGG